jgi:hypothetical protein
MNDVIHFIMQQDMKLLIPVAIVSLMVLQFVLKLIQVSLQIAIYGGITIFGMPVVLQIFGVG